MPITQNDIKFKHSKVVNDTAGNGGEVDNANVADLFPNVSGTEREAGITRYRKVFYKNEQASSGLVDLTLFNSKVYMERISPGDDFFRIYAHATDNNTDVQSDAAGYTGWAGVGFLSANITGPETDFNVIAEDASGFENGATLCVAYKDTDGTVHREFVTLTSKTWAGNVASMVTSGLTNSYERAYDDRSLATDGIYTASTVGSTAAAYTTDEHAGRLVRIYKTADGTLPQVRRIASNTTTTLTTTYPFSPVPDTSYSYEIIKTYVSQVVNLGDLVAGSSNWLESVTGDGTYNEGAYPLRIYPVGAIDQDWTIHFTSTTQYNVIGSTLGTVVTGQLKSADCMPSNPGSGSYYFKLEAAGFAGTWDNGDEITFTTSGSYAGFWVKQVVAANVPTCGDNTWHICNLGDTV